MEYTLQMKIFLKQYKTEKNVLNNALKNQTMIQIATLHGYSQLSPA